MASQAVIAGMKQMKIELKLTVQIMALLLVTLLVSSALSIISNERMHEQQAVSTLVPSLIDIRAFLAKSFDDTHSHASPGQDRKNLKKRVRLDALDKSKKLLEEQFRFVANLDLQSVPSANRIQKIEISLSDADGLIKNSTNKSLLGTKVPNVQDMKPLQYDYPESRLPQLRYTLDNDTLLITFSIQSTAHQSNAPGGEATGIIRVKNSYITAGSSQSKASIKHGFKWALLIGVAMMFAMLFGLSHWSGGQAKREKQRIVWTLILVLSSAQLTSFFLNWTHIQSDWITQIDIKTQSVATLVKKGIEGQLNEELQLESDVLDVLLKDYASLSECISHIAFFRLEGNEGRVQDAETKKAVADSPVSFSSVVMSAVQQLDEKTTYFDVVQRGVSIGTGEIVLAVRQINQQLVTNLLDSGIILLITLLISIELSVLLLTHREKSRDKEPSTLGPANPSTKYKAMRPGIFFFLLGIDFSMSIIPLHMERLYSPVMNFSKEVIIGLPISIEFLCVGIAILLSGVWLDRRGWVSPFIAGIVITVSGCIYSWLAPDAFHFILSRALLGFGYGLTLLAAQGFVIGHTDDRNKAQGLAHLFAGLYSGSICGAAAGAMIAERFGYQWTFLMGAVLVSTVVVYGYIFVGYSSREHPVMRRVAKTTKATAVSVWQFLTEKRVIVVICLSSLPASIAAIGFLNYFTPIYLDRSGVSEEKIGQILMLFGICLATLGPAIARVADTAQSKKTPIIIGGFLGGLAFLSFDFLHGVTAVTFAVVLLGLSNCLVLPSQSAYLLRLDITQAFGEGKAMGIFRATSRIGQMLGPIVFASLMGLADISSGVYWFGCIYLLIAILFLLLAEREFSRRPEEAASKC